MDLEDHERQSPLVQLAPGPVDLVANAPGVVRVVKIKMKPAPGQAKKNLKIRWIVWRFEDQPWKFTEILGLLVESNSEFILAKQTGPGADKNEDFVIPASHYEEVEQHLGPLEKKEEKYDVSVLNNKVFEAPVKQNHSSLALQIHVVDRDVGGIKILAPTAGDDDLLEEARELTNLKLNPVPTGNKQLSTEEMMLKNKTLFQDKTVVHHTLLKIPIESTSTVYGGGFGAAADGQGFVIVETMHPWLAGFSSCSIRCPPVLTKLQFPGEFWLVAEDHRCFASQDSEESQFNRDSLELYRSKDFHLPLQVDDSANTITLLPPSDSSAMQLYLQAEKAVPTGVVVLQDLSRAIKTGKGLLLVKLSIGRANFLVAIDDEFTGKIVDPSAISLLVKSVDTYVEIVRDEELPFLVQEDFYNKFMGLQKGLGEIFTGTTVF